MAKLNVPAHAEKAYTHEGATTLKQSNKIELQRAVCACLLWEDTFYESGQSIAERISLLIPYVSPSDVAQLAINARELYKLRHVPLLLVREMARLDSHKHLVAETLSRVIQRPDELTEFLAIYWQNGRQPVSAQVKRGLAEAFTKFNEYQLAKYNRDEKIKLKDVLFISHAKAKNEDQDALWKRLIAGELATPDTWEVELSAKGNNKDSWERLLAERKLGGLALLRNLRNMTQAGVERTLIKTSIEQMRVERVLPFRFISAARYAPQFEPELDAAMLKSLSGAEKLPGKTVLVIDGSGSMFGTTVSKRSEIDRFEAAAALAILAREICEDCEVICFSNNSILVPPRRGFALRDVLYKAAPRGGTYTQFALDHAKQLGYDRCIVFTDEQSHQAVKPPNGMGYIVNIGTYRNGIGYGSWTHVDGFSEAVLEFIKQFERIG